MANWEMGLTRKGYADGLVELGRETDNVVVLDADLSQSTLTKFFAKENPERFFEMGIAEQGMVATAAGLSQMGFKPFVTSYAMFVAGRSWEIVRQQISYTNADLVVAGAHAGISVGKDGPTHQCVEDLALMRVLPNMQVIVPCDYWEMKKTVKYCGTHRGPFYFRMTREKSPIITTEDEKWEFGKAKVMKEGTDATIFSCGLAMHMALEAGEILEKEGINTRVVNMHTIKPIDHDAILSAANETGAILTAEEHSVMGGFGSAIAESLVQSGNPVPMKIMGLEDKYLESGDPVDLFAQANLTSACIAEGVKELLQKKMSKAV